jgi:hypothetical protein
MKAKFATGMAFALCAATLTFGGDGTWTGYISDSHCGAQGANANHANCAAKCVKDKNASYVFVNDGDRKVYNITDQDKVADHAGHHVTVKGSLNGESLTIASVEMAK